jgi:polyferredoxin
LVHKQASSSVRWVKARKVVQGVSLLIFTILVITSTGLAWPTAIVNFPIRLDPLLMISQSIASRQVLAGSLISLGVILLTLVFGRAWCGWLCPLGTLLDVFQPSPKKGEKESVSDTWRRWKYLLLVGILVLAVFGNLTLLFLDPITIWVRTMAGVVLPGLDFVFTALEKSLSNIPGFSDPLGAMDQIIRPAVLPQTPPPGLRFPWIPALLFTSIVLLNFIASRFWCRYLCPLGGMLGWLSRFSFIKRVVGSGCKECGVCQDVCPTGTIDPKRGYQSDPAECTMCLNCLPSCKLSSTSFQTTMKPAQPMPYDPDRRSFFTTIFGSVAALTVLGSDQNAQKTNPLLLRPPGAVEQNLTSKCLRCGECIRACPTGALQASILDGGLERIFTPLLIPRLGYCDFSCNRCGQICPVEAISPLELEEKRKFVIGWAFIDENHCIPWADGTPCIVCEEMCPVPEKAILLEERQVTGPDNSINIVQLPRVIRERCIGCGICEYKCPRAGNAAIRVYRSDEI